MRQVTGRRQRKDVAIDGRFRDLLNKPAKAEREAAPTLQKILVNMERWRYLPDDLGAFHIWNNLPQFETRVVRGGEVIHQEARDRQAEHADAGVLRPDGVRRLQSRLGRSQQHQDQGALPSLARRRRQHPGSPRHEDRGQRQGNASEPHRLGPDRHSRGLDRAESGPSNPLGQLKFMFPNRHDVYMHDTPSKNLFASSVRTFSHGCIRVRNPRRLAEVIFANDRNWSARDISAKLQSRIENNRIELAQPIPVHNVYFTLVADDKGGLRSLPDVYGHDKRMGEALDGKPVERIAAAADPARKLAQEIEGLAQSGGTGIAVAQTAAGRFAAEDPYGWGPSADGVSSTAARRRVRAATFAAARFFFGN